MPDIEEENEFDPDQLIPATGKGNGHKYSTGNNRGLGQAYELREIASEHARELRHEPVNTLQEKAMRAQALRNLASVWEVASERIRIIRGRPMPGSLRPERKPTKAAKVNTAPTETPE